jgi:hypothetical protein
LDFIDLENLKAALKGDFISTGSSFEEIAGYLSSALS